MGAVFKGWEQKRSSIFVCEPCYIFEQRIVWSWGTVLQTPDSNVQCDRRSPQMVFYDVIHQGHLQKL
jgi:hypothetical protein